MSEKEYFKKLLNRKVRYRLKTMSLMREVYHRFEHENANDKLTIQELQREIEGEKLDKRRR